MKKKILVLGAGIGQVPVILKARELGHYVVVISIEGNYPGLQLANKVYYEDVRNKEEVLRIAMKEGIDAALSDQNDIPVETLGYLCENLNLIGNNYEISRLFTQKDLMRAKCKVINVPSVDYRTAYNLEDALNSAREIGYPVMCKPVDNQSSKGVFRVNNPLELEQVFDKALLSSFKSRVIIEKFIKGPEFVIEGMAINSVFKNLLLLDRTYFDLEDIFIPSMITSPSRLPHKKREELLELNHKVCTSYGLQNGLSHSEFILNELDNKFYLVEVAARGGGVYTSSHLLSFACGFNTSEFLIDLSLGKPMDISDYKFAERAVRYICFYLKPGTIMHVKGVDYVKKMEQVIEFFDDTISINKGYGGLKDKSDRLGPILLGANTLEELEETTKCIRKELVVTTDKFDNAIIWD